MATYTVEVAETGQDKWLTLATEHADILPARQTAKQYIHRPEVHAVRIVAGLKNEEKVVDEWSRDSEGRMIRTNHLDINPNVNHIPKESDMAKAKAAAAKQEADELLGEAPVQTVKKGKAKDVPKAKTVAEDLLGEEPKKAKKATAAKKEKAPAKPKETIEQRNERLRAQAKAMSERAAARKAEAAAAAEKAAKAEAKAAKASKKAAA